MPRLLALIALCPTAALAAWPEDVTPSAMTTFDGQAQLNSGNLGKMYSQLVAEVGTMVANKPLLPAETLGANGWEVGLTGDLAFNEARDRCGALYDGSATPNAYCGVSPWQLAHQEEEQLPYQWIPGFSARKGLPLSTEIGFNAGWIGMSNTGTFGGYGRVALVEGYKPWPDISLQVGYGGYVGNRELQVRTMDLGVTIGTTAYTGSLPGIHVGSISPWANFSLLRVTSKPVLDEDVADDIGAKAFMGGTTEQGAVAPIALPRVAVGWQVTSQNLHARVGLAWTPQTIPTLSTGIGTTF